MSVRRFAKRAKHFFKGGKSHIGQREKNAALVNLCSFIAHCTQALISILCSLVSAACPPPGVAPSPAVSVCRSILRLVLLRLGFFFFSVTASPSPSPDTALAAVTALSAESFAADFVARGAAPA